MSSSPLNATWIWHPQWKDHAEDSAGAFVHFRKQFTLQDVPCEPIRLQVTADTKYRLYLNGHFVHIGPVKGDEHIWFYDEVDISSYLRPGLNNIGIHVLRLYHGTPYGTSFPRMSFPGLLVRAPDATKRDTLHLDTDGTWSVSIDPLRKLRIDQAEDDFLHIYEDIVSNGGNNLEWTAAKCLKLPQSHGIGPPWMLSPRMIPEAKITPVRIKALHNIESSLSDRAWERFLLHDSHDQNDTGLLLPAGTSHHIELEADHHMIAFLRFRFERPSRPGSSLQVTYAECYEDEPHSVPYVRCKGDRLDTSKGLFGPADQYVFSGQLGAEDAAALQYTTDPMTEEVFTPFHFRTFRFIALDVTVNPESDLVMKGLDMNMTHYPLQVTGEIHTDMPIYNDLWTTSIRTLTNCMHDCYQDCPFYEQLQYAMDVRSSCLFTYYVSGDDRLARQAIIQLHSSYRADLCLLASRSPASQLQIIPHFSLFWILTVVDHFEHFGDAQFTRQFLPVCDGILEGFAARIEPQTGLVSSKTRFWDFVDWTDEWRPMGIPPAAEATGYQTFTNMLYSYTMQRLAHILGAVGRPSLQEELKARANVVIMSIRQHCRIGEVFTDGLASAADQDRDFSQHNQIWAILCGAVSGEPARDLLRRCLSLHRNPGTSDGQEPGPSQTTRFTKPSVAMSFYLHRALSTVGGNLYDDVFHDLWQPWADQLSQNLTTWCEDDVTKRSDCHAWSCAPLHELMAEVAGVQPAEPGWNSVSFAPRTRLFHNLEARVPLAGRLAPGTALVKWTRDEQSDVTLVTFSLDTKASIENVTINVCFPDGRKEVHKAQKERSLTLKF